MSYLAINKGDVHHYRGDKVAVEGKTKFASLFISPNKDFGREVKPRWCFTYESRSRLAKKKKVRGFRCTLRRCWASLGSWVVWSWLLRFPWTQHWFLLLVGFPETIRCVEKRFCWISCISKTDFFLQIFQKENALQGLDWKRIFQKKESADSDISNEESFVLQAKQHPNATFLVTNKVGWRLIGLNWYTHGGVSLD